MTSRATLVWSYFSGSEAKSNTEYFCIHMSSIWTYVVWLVYDDLILKCSVDHSQQYHNGYCICITTHLSFITVLCLKDHQQPITVLTGSDSKVCKIAKHFIWLFVGWKVEGIKIAKHFVCCLFVERGKGGGRGEKTLPIGAMQAVIRPYIRCDSQCLS